MELPKRKSPRISGYDYSKPNYYFITICTHEKKCIFGRPGNLNPYGKAAEECLLKIQEMYSWIRIDNYVVMPNHVHAIMIANEHEDEMDIAMVIGQYKMAVTKLVRRSEPEMVLWQRSFHDHIIRSQISYEKIWTYIADNPRKWEEDCFYYPMEESVTFREGH